MRRVIDDVVNGFSDRLDSHKSSWPRMQRCMMEDVVGPVELAFGDDTAAPAADVWIVSHAMEFDGETYNMFGGWNEKVRDRVQRWIDFTGTRVSIERPMPDLGVVLKPRIDKAPDHLKLDLDALSEACRETAFVPHERYFPHQHSAVFGDSHSVGFYRQNTHVFRNDGMTLHTMVSGAVERWAEEQQHSFSGIQLVGGNIDVRHHLGRHGDPTEMIDDLFDKLVATALLLKRHGRAQFIALTHLMPVEHEGRKVPKSGWYKGTPYFLPREQRAEAVKRFNGKLDEILTEGTSIGVVDGISRLPDEWFTMDPEEFAKTRMEKPGSVHLSPRWHVWDYETNSPNTARRKEHDYDK